MSEEELVAFQRIAERFEPGVVYHTLNCTEEALASIAISLKRIADTLDAIQPQIEGLAHNVGFLSMKGS